MRAARLALTSQIERQQTLREYRDELVRRIEATARPSRVDGAVMRSTMRFLHELDLGLAALAPRISAASQREQALRSAWIERQQRADALARLAERRESAHRRIALRREQEHDDETAARTATTGDAS